MAAYTTKPSPNTKRTGKVATDNLGTSTGTSRTVRTSKEEKKNQASLESFMATARKRFRGCTDDESDKLNRDRALDDTRFYNGDQWDAIIKARYKARGRPALTLNRVKPAVKQVTNTQRQNRPAIAVFPVDDKGDIRTAKIFSGLIRHIEVNSMADIAYDVASKAQVIHGTGYLRVVTDFASPMSMNQEAYIWPVDDPFAVYLGPYSRPDCSDLDYAFIVRDLDGDQYEAEFGEKSQFSGLQDFSGVGNQAKGWGNKKTIRVADYYHRVKKKITIVQLNDGSVFDKAKIPQYFIDQPDKLGIVDERETEIPTVKFCTINGVERFNEEEFPSMYIPIIPVYGDTTVVDGVTHRSGIVRDAKDAQRQYNYFRSKMTETVALAPTAPWVMAEGQDEGHEREWDTANTDNYSVLRYKPRTLGANLAPPPQRQQFEPAIQALVVASSQYEDDIKATTQVYDPKLGSKSNEVSGRSQQIRINQSDTGNYDYTDNFNRSLRHLGLVLLDIIPRIYDARTIARIIGEDDKPQQISVISDPAKHSYNEEETEDGGIKQIYNIGVGQYDVAIGTGPGYLSRRQEAFDLLTKLVNSFPQLMEIAGDKVLENSDIPGAKEVADRLKRAIQISHPGVIEDDSEEGSIPPKVKKAVDQLMSMNEQLTKKVEELNRVIETDQIKSQAGLQEAQLKAQSTKEIEMIRSMTVKYTEDMKAASTEHIAAIKAVTEEAKLVATANEAKLSSSLSLLETIIAAINKPGPVESTA